MKKIASIVVLCLILFTSCGGIRTTTKGLENESFLEFVSQSNTYPDGVVVTIDNTIKFTADVYKDKVERTKGNVYAISTGSHHLSISYNNDLIYSKKIFISAQETKYIMLP